MARSVRFFVVFAVALFLRTLPAEACSCGLELPPLEALRSATAVFEGTIVDQRAVLTDVHGDTTAAIIYEVALTRMWKGTPSPVADLLRRGPCDPILHVGSAYLVYAESDESGRLLAAACTRTVSAQFADEDFQQLGPPAESFAIVSRTLLTSMPFNRRWRAYAVAGIAVYVWMFSEPRDALLSLPAALAFVVALQLCVGLFFIARHRRRSAALALTGALITAAFAVLWCGQQLLREEWFSPFLTW